MREAGTRAEKIKEVGGSRKGFLLLPQPRSQAPLRVGEEPGNQVPFPLPSPYLPLFVCLFVCFCFCCCFFSRFKFLRNNSSGNGCYAGSFRVRIFCHRVPKLQTNCVTVRMLERFGGELTVEIRWPPSHVVLFNNLILRTDLLSFSAIHNVNFAQVLQVLLLFFPA